MGVTSASHQIYTHLNNVFELLSKAVVESKQKVNIPKLSKEEPEEKEEKNKREEERGGAPLPAEPRGWSPGWF